MAKREHRRILGSGVRVWNEWRKDNPEVTPDLLRARLRGADLNGVDLGEAKLKDADLRGADLREANLNGADLSWADLSEADLSGTDLSGTGLYGANLRRAKLRKANLSRANLESAILSEANLSEADLSGADLHGANLTGANLSGADLRSADLALNMLEPANLSETTYDEFTVWPEYDVHTMRPLNFNPKEYGARRIEAEEIPEHLEEVRDVTTISNKTIFVSYSRQDSNTVDKIISKLEAASYQVWIDRTGIRGGEQWRRQIVEAIENCEAFVIVLSPNSIKSRNVRKELDLADSTERRILPVVIKAVSIPKDMRY